MQNSILLLFLILAALSALIFTFVFLSSTKAGVTESGLSNPLRKRFWFLLILFMVLGILASVTIPRSPYFLFADENPSRVIHVAAKQFVFFMSDVAIDAEKIRLSLSQLYREKPVLLALIFTRCAGICNPFLFQLKENLRSDRSTGEFTVLVLSFDPKDTHEDMLFLSERLKLDNNKQWIFATTTDIEKLNQSVGLNPVWDNDRAQYDHDALLAGINKEGYITKKLIGLRDRQDLRLLIRSVNGIFSPSYRLPNNNQLFSCFNYNPRTGKSTLGLGIFVLALPAIITLFMVVGISYGARQKRISAKKGKINPISN